MPPAMLGTSLTSLSSFGISISAPCKIPQSMFRLLESSADLSEMLPAYTLECYRGLQRYSMDLHCKVQCHATYLVPSPQREHLVSIFVLQGCQSLQADVNNYLVPGNTSLLTCVTQPTQMHYSMLQSACLRRHGKQLKMGSPATARECRLVWQNSRSKQHRLLSRFALKMPC